MFSILRKHYVALKTVLSILKRDFQFEQVFTADHEVGWLFSRFSENMGLSYAIHICYTHSQA